jgi:hypothetical protein
MERILKEAEKYNSKIGLDLGTHYKNYAAEDTAAAFEPVLVHNETFPQIFYKIWKSITEGRKETGLPAEKRRYLTTEEKRGLIDAIFTEFPSSVKIKISKKATKILGINWLSRTKGIVDINDGLEEEYSKYLERLGKIETQLKGGEYFYVKDPDARTAYKISNVAFKNSLVTPYNILYFVSPLFVDWPLNEALSKVEFENVSKRKIKDITIPIARNAVTFELVADKINNDRSHGDVIVNPYDPLLDIFQKGVLIYGPAERQFLAVAKKEIKIIKVKDTGKKCK